MNIAIIQFKIAHLKQKENFARIEMFVRRATSKKADVVVFPEDCVTGSIFGNKKYLDHGKVRKKFQMLAKKYDIDIVTGSCMEQTESGIFNTSYYIDAHGDVLGQYHKNHLYDTENHFLDAGKDISVFDTKFGKAGIIICWDILFADQFENMKKAGVQIVYCPSYWYKEIAGEKSKYNKNSEEQLIDALCIARAREFDITCVYANAAGTMKYHDGTRDTLIGHSQITAPFIGVVKKLEHNREAIILASADNF